MVEAKCLVLFLLSSWLFLDGARAFHPIAQAMNPGKSDQNSNSDSSEEGNVISNLEDFQKRGPTKNFLRFGKSEPPLVTSFNLPDESDEISEEEKRASRNFLRFGRGPQRNFLRFGKSSPLLFGLGIEPESSEEIPADYATDVFHRSAKAANRNFLRYGRSTDSQLNEKCIDCLPQESEKQLSRSRRDAQSESPVETENGISKRSKRSVSAFYNDVEFIPHTPLSWGAQYEDLIPQVNRVPVDGTSDLQNKDQKRSQHRSFLRYGRDPLDLHFLRFGKRGSTESTEGEDPFSRYIRARSSKNFLRFG